MSHFLIGLVALLVIAGGAFAAIFPRDSTRSGPENGWMNAEYLAREKERQKAEKRRERAAVKARPGRGDTDA